MYLLHWLDPKVTNGLTRYTTENESKMAPNIRTSVSVGVGVRLLINPA